MVTNEDHLSWARDQMDTANTPLETREVVEKLLTLMLEKIPERPRRKETLSLFNNLADGISINEPMVTEERWMDVRPGNIVLRDQIRVKNDAYSGDAGLAHNGRRGVVVAIRNGDIRVKYKDGKKPSPEWVAHSPFSLEKLV